MKTKQMMMAIVSKRDKMPKNQAKKMGQSIFQIIFSLFEQRCIFTAANKGKELSILYHHIWCQDLNSKSVFRESSPITTY